MIETTTQEYNLPYLKDYPQEYLYESGLPFSTKLAENLDALLKRVAERKAVMIIIDGAMGYGKTTLATHVADYCEKQQIDFDLQMAMGGEQFMVKLKLCFKEGKLVIVYDEGGDFNKRGALKKFNATLNRIFETFRAYKIVVIVVLPNFNNLDSNLFDNKVPRLLLHITGRSMKYGRFKGYSLNGMFWLRHWMKKEVVREIAFQKVQPNFVGYFRDLPPERSRQLDRISTKGKLNELEKVTRSLEGLYTYQEIAVKSEVRMSRLRSVMQELKVKPTVVEGRKKYFDKATMERVMHEIIERREKRNENISIAKRLKSKKHKYREWKKEYRAQ